MNQEHRQELAGEAKQWLLRAAYYTLFGIEILIILPSLPILALLAVIEYTKELIHDLINDLL